MIKGTVKIREKTFKDMSLMWNIDQYSKEGLYLIKDGSEIAPDQLVFAGITTAGVLPIVTYIGNWETINKFFGEVDLEEKAMDSMKEIAPMDFGGTDVVSGDLLLDVLSIAMHGKKAK